MRALLGEAGREQPPSRHSTWEKDEDGEAERSLFLANFCEPVAQWSCGRGVCKEPDPDMSQFERVPAFQNPPSSYDVDMLVSRSGREREPGNVVSWWEGAAEGTVHAARTVLSTVTCRCVSLKIPPIDPAKRQCQTLIITSIVRRNFDAEAFNVRQQGSSTAPTFHKTNTASSQDPTVRSGFQASRTHVSHALLAEERPPWSPAYEDVVRRHRGMDDIMADGNQLNAHERQIMAFGK